MTLMTKTEISAIEQRCNQIQSNKWKMSKIVIGDVSFYDVVMNGDAARPYTKQECEFIIHARIDIPRLIQHINSLQNLLHKYQHVHEKLC